MSKLIINDSDYLDRDDLHFIENKEGMFVHTDEIAKMIQAINKEVKTLTSQLEKAEKENAILMEAVEYCTTHWCIEPLCKCKLCEALEKIKLLEAGE